MKKIIGVLGLLLVAGLGLAQNINVTTQTITPGDSDSIRDFVISDMNGDGRPDIVTSHQSGALKVHFQLPASYTVYDSCQARFENEPGTLPDAFMIDPDGKAGNIQPFRVYCDEEGWTLVIGVDETGAHENRGAVTPENLISPKGKGKFSDSIINQIKENGDDLIRVKVSNGFEYTWNGCDFNATTPAEGGCVAGKYASTHIGLAVYGHSDLPSDCWIAYTYRKRGGFRFSDGTCDGKLLASNRTGTVWVK